MFCKSIQPLQNSNLTKISQKHYLNNLAKDTVSFSGNISNSENTTAVDEFLNAVKNDSQEKFEFLKQNQNIINYLNKQYDESDFWFEYRKPNLEAIKTAIKNTNTEDLEKISSQISERYNDYNKEKIAENILNAYCIYSNDPNAYEYIISSEQIQENVHYSSGYTKDICDYIMNLPIEVIKNLTLAEVKEIQKGNFEDYDYSAYTTNSDNFKEEDAQKMREFLSSQKTENDIHAYRTEKSTWIFEQIPIDKSLERQTRLISFFNQKSRQEKIAADNKKYQCEFDENIYDYINSKKTLTLADAMLVTKYADKNYAKTICNLIEKSKIKDNRFKSYTLSKNFAEQWAAFDGNNQYNSTAMITNANIKAGSQARYCARSGQYEVILNDKEKEITFSNVQYDKEKNIFYFDSEVKML